MAWIEKNRGGFRARWRDDRSKVQAGPTFTTKPEARFSGEASNGGGT